MYINEVEDAALADPSGLRQATDRVWLGVDPWATELTLKGRLDNVRISNIARQPGDFGITVDANTKALWLLDGNGLDETGLYNLVEEGSISWSQSCSCGVGIPRGACCDLSDEDRPCREGVLAKDCPEPLSWTEGASCSDIGCVAIPTVSAWGLVVMTLLVLTAGTVVLRARRTATG